MQTLGSIQKKKKMSKKKMPCRQPSSGKEEEEIFKAGFDSNSEEDSKFKEGDQDIRPYPS